MDGFAHIENSADTLSLPALVHRQPRHVAVGIRQQPAGGVLEGELIIAGQRLRGGWASVASPGSVHADAHSETGCMFMLVDRPL